MRNLTLTRDINNMRLAKRLDKVPPYLFVQISRKIAEKKALGVEVISFGIGDPDLPTPKNVITRMQETALHKPNHRYPETEGLPEFRQAVADWYKSRFQIKLDPETEVMSLIGAKEGIGHAAFCFLDPGDIALVPDPGYPVYSIGTWFAGGECHWMPLLEQNEWLPDLDSIPNHVLERAKVMWLSYPNNPTGAIASLSYFEKVVDFAKRNDLIIAHDACYSEVAYDGYKPVSFLQVSGAKDIGIEFHSLSKSYNMTGWRLGMAVGNAELIRGLMIVKSNLDSGVPQAIQHMGIEALKSDQQSIDQRNNQYQRRRDRVVECLQNLGLEMEIPKASLYVWAKVPAGYSSAEFTEMLLEEKGVVVSPGPGYGQHGEGYIRLSLTISDEDLEKGLHRIESMKIPIKS